MKALGQVFERMRADSGLSQANVALKLSKQGVRLSKQLSVNDLEVNGTEESKIIEAYAEIFDTTVPRIRILAERLAGDVPQIARGAFGVPSYNRAFFCGRSHLVEEIKKKLRDHTVVVLAGLPGIGKSVLAIHLAQECLHQFDAIFWVDVASRKSVEDHFRTIKSYLPVAAFNQLTSNSIVDDVKNILNCYHCLIVLDNVSEIDPVRDYIPTWGRCRILITTLDSYAAGIGEVLSVPPISSEDGGRLILMRAGLISPSTTTIYSGIDQGHIKAAIDISEEVEGLPLALEQAGACILVTKMPPSEYLRRYRGDDGKDLRETYIEGNLHEHNSPVARTFQLLFDRLSEATKELLHVCSFMQVSKIPEEAIRAAGVFTNKQLADISVNDLKFYGAIAKAGKLSLLARDGDDNTIYMHRVVAAVLRDEIQKVDTLKWFTDCIGGVRAIFPKAIDKFSLPICNRNYAVARSVAENVFKLDTHPLAALELFNRLADYAHMRHRTDEANELHISATKLSGHVNQHEFVHSNTSISGNLKRLADSYYGYKNYILAEAIYRELLTIYDDESKELLLSDIILQLCNLYGEMGEIAKFSEVLDTYIPHIEHIHRGSPSRLWAANRQILNASLRYNNLQHAVNCSERLMDLYSEGYDVPSDDIKVELDRFEHLTAHAGLMNDFQMKASRVKERIQHVADGPVATTEALTAIPESEAIPGPPLVANGTPTGSPVKQPRVFISHNSMDKPFVRRLTDDLKKYELAVWFDEQELGVGDSIVQGVSNALKDTDYFVVVISQYSAQSKWVQLELSSALMNELAGKGIVVLPVRIDDTSLPPLLVDRIYADFRTDYDNGINALLRVFSQESTVVHRSIVRTVYQSVPVPCQSVLQELTGAQLRRRIDKRLSREDLEILWYDTFETRLEDDCPNRAKPVCIIELIERARREAKTQHMLSTLCELYEHIAIP